MNDHQRADLAATKLCPPVPSHQVVQRSRLDEILDAGIDRHARLVLISAPAGSGKSTMLAAWSAARAEAVAWLQAEAIDSDPARFWSYLVAAIERTYPIVGSDLQLLISGSNGDELVAVAGLVNALDAVAEPLVIVIDDYHLIDSADVHRGIERLIDLCPPQVTIVLSTRIDPPFRLGRLRVRNQLCEIRAADLRFDSGEAVRLLGPSADLLETDLLDQLCAQTEGWAAGLILAGLSLQHSANPVEFVERFRGDDHLIVEYLRDELLDSLDDDDRARLLETSILEQLSGGLLDAVTGSTDGTAWLRDTATSNQLLIALDRTGTWFRYHHLLRDLLRLEANDTIPQRLPNLHTRAAAWYQSQGANPEAIDHRLAAGQMDDAVQLLRVHGPELLRAGQITTLRGLLERFGDVARSSTTCAALYAWCEYIDGRYALAQSWLDTATAVAPAGLDLTAFASLNINIALARGDVATAVEMARRITATSQLVSYPADLATATGGAYAWAGLADEARTALQLAVEKATEERHRTAHLLALVYSTIVEFNSGAAATGAAASTAIETAERFGLGDYYGVAPAYAISARIQEDPAFANAESTRALQLARRASTDLALCFVLTVCGDSLNDRASGSGVELLLEARSIIDRCPDPGLAGRHLDRVESRHGIAERATPSVSLIEPVTDRELAVLRYLPTTMSQRDIAAELYISLNTVKTHCRSLYRKLGVGDRKAAVQAGRDAHLL